MGHEAPAGRKGVPDYRVPQGLSAENRDYDYNKDWVINPDADPRSSEAKSPYIDNGTDLIDRARYISPDFLALESDKLWPKTWLLAGRVSDLKETGDYIRFDVDRDSIIIVRSAPDEIRAFHNTCQHKGTRLVSDDCGHKRVFRCPYHSWAWKIDGSIAHVHDRETFRKDVLSGNLDLPRVRCETWAGFVFICMDEKAPPLKDFLDVLPAHLDIYAMEEMAVVKDASVLWPANWKVVLDAFMETYHVHTVHPEILPIFEEYYQQRDLYGNGMSRMLMPFGLVSSRLKDQDTVNAGLQMMLEEVGVDAAGFTGKAGDVRAAIQAAKRKDLGNSGIDFSKFTDAQLTDDWNYYIFPNITLNIHPEGVLIQRFRPHPTDPNQSYYDVMVILRPIKDPRAKPPAYMGVPDGTDCTGTSRPPRQHFTYGDGGMGTVLEQDGQNVPLVQQGMHSRGFKGARLSEGEQRIRHYQRELDRYLAGEKW